VTLPAPLDRFWEAMAAANPVCEPTAWGYLVADPRFPIVWDANHAAVLHAGDELGADELRETARAFLRHEGAVHEHIELWGLPARSTLRDELRDRLGRDLPRDVLMAFEGDPAALPSPPEGIRIDEVTRPDDRLRAWLHRSRNEFGEPLSEEVLDQLVGRDFAVFLPLGLRWFVATVGTELAGYTSLVSLAGVGYLDGVVTMPAFRRRGVASSTVAAAVRTSLGAGDQVVHLLAEGEGDPRRLYERMGFRSRAAVESFTAPLEGPATGSA
jgi:GNAT superfamily N-acetyltransferase